MVSVDVFDTILWRSVPRPTDAFLLLGRRLADEGLLQAGIRPRVFARMRVLAERSARATQIASRGTSEVHLEDIYGAMKPESAAALPASELARRELELECDLTQPDLRLVDYLTQLLDDVSLVDGHACQPSD